MIPTLAAPDVAPSRYQAMIALFSPGALAYAALLSARSAPISDLNWHAHEHLEDAAATVNRRLREASVGKEQP